VVENTAYIFMPLRDEQIDNSARSAVSSSAQQRVVAFASYTTRYAAYFVFLETTAAYVLARLKKGATYLQLGSWVSILKLCRQNKES
jgi:hypothetical protein